MGALLSTEDKTLIEASFDSDWGTGIPLSNENCLLKDQWKTEGILGKILTRIRSEAKETTASMNRIMTGPSTESETNL